MNLDHNFDVFAIACVWLNQILIQVNKTKLHVSVTGNRAGGRDMKFIRRPRAVILIFRAVL